MHLILLHYFLYCVLLVISSQRWSSTVPKLSYIHHIGTDPFQAITVGTALEKSAEKYGDRQAIISRHQKKVYTFQDILAEADALAAGLLTLELKTGDRLGLWAPNLVEWHVTKMACARAGLILVGMNY